MSLLQPQKKGPLTLRLARDLVRSIKRGHPWVFRETIRHCPPALAGSRAILQDNKKGRPIAQGFYDSASALAFRVCSTDPSEPLNDDWAHTRLTQAVALRASLFDDQTTGYRLFNGEGDGLPGLICDIYGETAVLQLDGDGPKGFWDSRGIADWLIDNLPLTCVYQREQSRSKEAGKALIGHVPKQPAQFLENGVRFTADLIQGQKTGFFLDQRANRHFVKRFATEQTILNLFGYTGGFS
ncbi:MAG: class I SAM-dependent methyltransferase, partial [Chloroflexota bacterium]